MSYWDRLRFPHSNSNIQNDRWDLTKSVRHFENQDVHYNKRWDVCIRLFKWSHNQGSPWCLILLWMHQTGSTVNRKFSTALQSYLIEYLCLFNQYQSGTKPNLVELLELRGLPNCIFWIDNCMYYIVLKLFWYCRSHKNMNFQRVNNLITIFTHSNCRISIKRTSGRERGRGRPLAETVPM